MNSSEMGTAEAEAFRQGLRVHDVSTRQTLATERLAMEMIEIKFLLRAFVENSRVKDAGPREKE